MKAIYRIGIALGVVMAGIGCDLHEKKVLLGGIAIITIWCVVRHLTLDEQKRVAR